MGFRDELARGVGGVELVMPASCTTQQDAPNRLSLQDRDHAVLWTIVRMPWRLDLDPETAALLREDAELEARCAFLQQFELEKLKGTPRTADMSWSPLVELEACSIGEGRALRVVHRLTYHPGSELIAGRLLIPTANGTTEIAALAVDNTTGFRESALMLMADRLAEGHPGQHEFDDPRHDQKFPGHALSRVRKALRWLQVERDVLSVAANSEAPSKGEIELPEVGCAVVPPPRYLALAKGGVPMAATLRMFTRVALRAGVSPRMVDVFRPAEATVHSRRELEALARNTNQGWAREGATDIELETRWLPDGDERPMLGCHVRFKINGNPTQSAQCWTAEPDGRVFRVAAGGQWASREDLELDAETTTRSLRALSRSSREVSKAKRPWWRLWR